MKIYWSKYNYKFYSEKFGNLLYNSFTNSFINIDDIINEIIELENDPEKFYNLSNALQKILLEMEVITENSPEDFLNSLKFKSLIRRSSQNSKSNFVLVPTLDCNFRCTYCFEQNAQNNKKVYMNKEVEDVIIKNITNEHKKNNTNIGITWYGGEPLMAFETIERISTSLNKQQVPYNASMLSNGYLLNSEIINKLEKFNINFLQITIDGDCKTHNKRRPHETNSDSYEKIIENLKSLHEKTFKVNVSLRVNLDQTNKSKFNEIEYELLKMYPNYKVDFAIIRNVPINSSCKNISNCINKKEKIDFHIQQYKKFGNENLKYYPTLNGIGDCGATGLYSWIIGPEGELYKCWNDVGEDKRIIGNIIDNKFSNVQLLNRYVVGVDPTEDPKCKECFCLPICGGGCPYNRMVNKYENKKTDNCIIQKGNKALGKFLEIQYDINLKKKILKEIEV